MIFVIREHFAGQWTMKAADESRLSCSVATLAIINPKEGGRIWRKPVTSRPRLKLFHAAAICGDMRPGAELDVTINDERITEKTNVAIINERSVGSRPPFWKMEQRGAGAAQKKAKTRDNKFPPAMAAAENVPRLPHKWGLFIV